MARRDRVLVIGASGRVGRMLRRYWQANTPKGLNLVYQTRREGTGQDTGQDQDILWDPLDGPQALAHQGTFDRVLILAGIVPGAATPLEGNRELGLACLDGARKVGAQHVLLTSTSAIYGTELERAYSEQDTPEPSHAYGITKLDMERACSAQAQASALPLTCLRIGNVAGADALLLNVAKSDGNPVTLDQFADGGGPLRSYIGIEHLAKVLETLLRAAPASLPDTLNVAAPQPIGMQELLEAAGETYHWRPAPPAAVQFVTLDCSALAAIHHFDKSASSAASMLREWQDWRADK